MMQTTAVENFPCFPEGINGPEMISKARGQAKKFGARFADGNVSKVEKKGNGFAVETEDGKVEGKAVIIATGASAKTLGMESEKKYWARGVHTCAVCDGYFYNGKEVVVVGGGDSAMEESLFLAKHATKVTIIHRRDKFRASKIMQDRVKANTKIKILWNSTVEDVLGDGKKVTSVKIKNVKNNGSSKMKTDAVFLAIGHIPNTKFLGNLVELDKQGFIKATNTHTNVPGIFAAGDCVDKIYRQAVMAAGDGCRAAIEAEKYLETS